MVGGSKCTATGRSLNTPARCWLEKRLLALWGGYKGGPGWTEIIPEKLAENTNPARLDFFQKKIKARKALKNAVFWAILDSIMDALCREIFPDKPSFARLANL